MTAGGNLILTLIQKLFATGRGEKIKRVSEDAEYRMKIMREFGLKLIKSAVFIWIKDSFRSTYE